MSKMDNLRAMREARYEAAAARGRQAAGGAPKAAAKAAPQAAAPKPAAAAPEPADEPGAEPAAAEALCGHRNMSGRTCTREQGHAAKSHRYS